MRSLNANLAALGLIVHSCSAGWIEPQRQSKHRFARAKRAAAKRAKAVRR